MLRNRKVVMVISLLIAVILWLYVRGEVNPTTTETFKDIHVQLLNTETLQSEDLAVIEKNYTVNVTIEGARSDVQNVKKKDIVATADVFGYKEGEHYIQVNIDDLDNVKVKKINDENVKIKIEKLISVYKNVKVEFTGEANDGDAEAGNVEISPKEIEVKGPATEVDIVSAVQVQVPVTKFSEGGSKATVKPIALDKRGKEVKSVTLSSNSVEISAVLYYTKEVPLEYKVKGELPKGYQLTDIKKPDKIVVRGQKSLVDKVNKIKAEDVDLSTVKADTTLPLKAIMPEGIEVAEASKNIGVEVSLKGLGSRVINVPANNIDIKNVGKGLTAHVNTDKVKITLVGRDSVLKNLSIDNFSVIVNADGMKRGNYNATVTVYCNKNIENVQWKPKKVKMTINKE